MYLYDSSNFAILIIDKAGQKEKYTYQLERLSNSYQLLTTVSRTGGKYTALVRQEVMEDEDVEILTLSDKVKTY